MSRILETVDRIKLSLTRMHLSIWSRCLVRDNRKGDPLFSWSRSVRRGGWRRPVMAPMGIRPRATQRIRPRLFSPVCRYTYYRIFSLILSTWTLSFVSYPIHCCNLFVPLSSSTSIPSSLILSSFHVHLNINVYHNHPVTIFLPIYFISLSIPM